MRKVSDQGSVMFKNHLNYERSIYHPEIDIEMDEFYFKILDSQNHLFNEANSNVWKKVNGYLNYF